MGHEHRWDPCIAHRDADVDRFLTHHFAQPDRNVLLVAGAGFDPRACAVAARLGASNPFVRALLVKEERPDPPQDQVERAVANTAALLAAVAERRVESIDIFGSDGAVIGGRKIINVLSRQVLVGVTDVVVDISALSVGTSFPIIRYFVERIVRGNETANLHLLVAHDPRLDADIRSKPSDTPGYVHGFKGRSTLFDAAEAARLWLPQLTTGRRRALGRLYDFIDPHDTCPILPFPASNPRLGDKLAEEYLTELEDTWTVDTRNIVYADDGDPLETSARTPKIYTRCSMSTILSTSGRRCGPVGNMLIERNPWRNRAGAGLDRVRLQPTVVAQLSPAAPSRQGQRRAGGHVRAGCLASPTSPFRIAYVLAKARPAWQQFVLGDSFDRRLACTHTGTANSLGHRAPRSVSVMRAAFGSCASADAMPPKPSSSPMSGRCRTPGPLR